MARGRERRSAVTVGGGVEGRLAAQELVNKLFGINLYASPTDCLLSMKNPKIDWPSQAKTEAIIQETGLTKAEMEDLISSAIRRAEHLADVALLYVKPFTTGDEDAWEGRWNGDEVLRKWFGRIDRPDHATDVYRRLETAYERLSSKVLTVHVKVELPNDYHAQNLGGFLSPKAFRVAPKWFTYDVSKRGVILIHELLHEWFPDQKLESGETVYGSDNAKQLAVEDPYHARRSPENYEWLCRDLDERLPGLSFRPSVVNFGSVAPRDSRTLTVTAKNTAGSNVTMSFSASSPNAIFRWGAVNLVIANGAEATFELAFHPTSNAIQRETLRITSTDSGSPHSLGLLGKGVGGIPPAPEEPPLPTALQFSSTLVNFGSVAVGSSGTRTLTISNATGASVAVSYAGSPAGVFQWGGFDGVLAHNSEHRVEMTFRSSGVMASGSLVVTSATASSPTVVSLIGKGPGGF